MRRSLKALSALLSYPNGELQAALGEIETALAREQVIPGATRRELGRLVRELETGDLMDLQERYVSLFDRTRSLSLHLFEHVHGESRDRGQAMIDLKSLYESRGLSMGPAELPDYVPLFLEFLSTLPDEDAADLIGEPAHVFAALAERLRKRDSSYAAVFTALQAMAKTAPAKASVDALIAEADPEPDDLAALDAAWEDEPVQFGPGAGEDCKDRLIARIRAGRRPVETATRRTPTRH